MSIYEALSKSLRKEELVYLATVASGERLGRQMLLWPDGRSLGDLGSAQANEEARGQIANRQTGLTELAELEVFFEVFPPPPKLVIVGAVHVAIHLVAFANRLGFRTLVVDARAAFATRERFPHADELIVEWPGQALAKMPLHESTYCVFLTHDPKLDEPAMKVALEAGVGYVGALGSKRTHAKRVASLLEAGLKQELIDRICAPIGIALGGRKPEEIAVSVAAELVQARYGELPAGRGRQLMKSADTHGIRVAAAVLAAGSSRRMSDSSGHELNKLLCRIDGVSLLRRSCETVLAVEALEPIVVVLGHQADSLRAELLGLDVETILNPTHLEGQASSVRLATQRLESNPTIDAVLFVPADQPGLDSATIESLCARFSALQQQQPTPIVAPSFEGRRGAPVLFPRRLFPQLLQLQGDEGGRQLLRQPDELLSWVELGSPLPLEDADTPEAFLAICERLGATPCLLGSAP